MIALLLRRLFHLLKRTRVYALVGAAGTGKSFRAQLVARRHNIDLIIDDGLLIRGERIVAGRSAKKEKAILAAVRRALFVDYEHMVSVRRALAQERFSRVLIVATSEEMARRIAKRLGIPQPAPSRIIHIEKIASPEEIFAAGQERAAGGKHIIPVPPVQLRRDYSHIIIDSVKVFFRRRFGALRRKRIFEKTIVQPEYGKRGGVAISETAVAHMIAHCVDELEPELTVQRVHLTAGPGGFDIAVDVAIPFGFPVAGRIHALRDYIHESIERYTGILLHEVQLTVSDVKKI